MNTTLEDLETRITWLEQANAELSSVVYRQQQELDALRQSLTDMTARFAAAQAQTTNWTAEQEKPPHY